MLDIYSASFSDVVLVYVLFYEAYYEVLDIFKHVCKETLHTLYIKGDIGIDILKPLHIFIVLKHQPCVHNSFWFYKICCMYDLQHMWIITLLRTLLRKCDSMSLESGLNQGWWEGGGLDRLGWTEQKASKPAKQVWAHIVLQLFKTLYGRDTEGMCWIVCICTQMWYWMG